MNTTATQVKHNNGVRHGREVVQNARKLRANGLTHREITKNLGIGLGSAWLWTRDISLNAKQKTAIQERRDKHAFTKERRMALSCSARAILAPYQYQRKYTKEDLLAGIKKFYISHGRIPLKRELGNRRIYRQHFGTWNNAIRAAGFKPNPVLFSNKFVAKDGHYCDSFSEKIIDEWLHDQKVIHGRNLKYGKTKMTADFFIAPNIVIEFFGLAGVQKKYDRIIKRKKELCRKLNLKLIEVYPKDLIPKSRLSELLS